MDGKMNMSKYDRMVSLNRQISEAKIELARRTIFEMLDEGEKISVPKLIIKTGLSRGFFYKNPTIRRLVDEAMEKQVGLVDPRRGVFEMAMDNEMIQLHEQIRVLQKENQRLTEENIKLKKAMDRKNLNLLRSI